MLVSYDAAARATYVQISPDPVVSTVELSDLVMVDLDEHQHPVGVEFLQVPAEITPQMVDLVVERFPILKVLRDPDRWLAPGEPRTLAHH
jgi:uncharacterized protein YuzE